MQVQRTNQNSDINFKMKYGHYIKTLVNTKRIPSKLEEQMAALSAEIPADYYINIERNKPLTDGAKDSFEYTITNSYSNKDKKSVFTRFSSIDEFLKLDLPIEALKQKAEELSVILANAVPF